MPFRGRFTGPDNIFQVGGLAAGAPAELTATNNLAPNAGQSRLTDPTTFANEHTANVGLHIPGVDATMMYRGQLVTFAANEPIIIEPALYAAAMAAGVVFTL